MRLTHLFPALPFAAAMMTLCPTVPAQGVSGTVTWNGKPIRDARVTFAAIGARVRTDVTGAYSFDAGAIGPRPSASQGRINARMPQAGLAAFGDPRTGEWRRGDGRRFAAGGREPGRAAAKIASPGAELSVSARGYRTRKLLHPGAGRMEIALERDYRRHLWVWEAEVLTNAALRDSLFAFGTRKGVGTYYVNAGGVLGSKDAQLAAFLDSAAARDCAVELLFGAPEWALAANHGVPLDLAGKAKALAASQDRLLRTAPTSIQYDVEPYSLDAYVSDPNGVGSQWVDMYVGVSAALKGTGIGVTACVPRWLETRPVTRGGVTRTLDRWLADNSDRLTLMDYVDHAKGIRDGAAGEMAYADTTGREVVVGVETLADLDPPSVTFAEEGEAAMEAALGAVDPDFRKHASYFGIAIHHWRAYEKLKP